jgi:hypothetical protein
MNQKHILKMTTALIFAVIVLLYPLTGCTLQPAEKHTVPEIRFSDVEKWVKRFEDPKRLEWQKPDEVVRKLSLKPGDVVADIGAGTGYFTRRFARAVGSEGRAFGLDIEILKWGLNLWMLSFSATHTITLKTGWIISGMYQRR